MDFFNNDRINKMFEMIGTSLTNIMTPQPQTADQESTIAPPSSSSSSNSSLSSNNSTTKPSSVRSNRSLLSLHSRSKLRIMNQRAKKRRTKDQQQQQQRSHHHHHHHHSHQHRNSKQQKEYSTKSRRSKQRQSQTQSIGRRNERKTNDKNSNTNSLSLPFASGLNVHLFDQQSLSQSQNDDQSSQSITTMLNRRYNCSVFFIHCMKHRKIALTKPTVKQAVWMPFMPMPSNKSWNEGGLAGLLIILSNGDMDTFVQLKNNHQTLFIERYIIEIAAIQLPQTLELINRITWMIKLDSDSMKNSNSNITNFKCCQDNESIIWIDEKKLDSGTVDYMWGPELIDFYRTHIVQPSSSNTATIIHDDNIGNNSDKSKLYWCNLSRQTIGHRNSFIEYNLEQAFQFLPRNPPRTDEEAMLLSSNLSEKDIERLYSDYLDHCYPSMSMAFHSFRIYMTKYGFQFEDERLTHLFFAFNYNSNGSITFPELLMGLACIDCYSIHNEVRAKFVMRYYDVQKRNYLTKNDIKQMLIVIHPKLKSNEIDEKLMETLRAMDVNVNHNDNLNDCSDYPRISYKTFVSAVGSHRFRGTSKLCRADRPVFQMITNIIFTRRKKQRLGREFKWSSVIDEQYAGICSTCKEKQTNLSEYLLKINPNGYVCDRLRLKHYHRHYHRDKKSKSSSSSASSKSLSSKISSSGGRRRTTKLSPNKFEYKFYHKNDNNDYEILNLSWKLLNDIREFLPFKGDTKNPNGFMAKNVKELYDYLLMIEKYLIEKFEHENRCVMISSPVFIIGDIHGNIDDLFTLEQSIWKQYPTIDGNLLFLGDYVDRGRWSIECVIYLMSLKILLSNKMTLLRGNHEVRPLQIHYSYRNECLGKYGDDYGQKIWELTNRLFDRLPLCAIIDESIYCSHGGIPRSTIDIQEIQRLNNFIPEPEHSFPIAWEILWSDPIHQQQFLELSCLMNYNNNNNNGVNDNNEYVNNTNNEYGQQQQQPQQQQSQQQQYDGFLPNRKRGTAYVFNEDAATRFLKHNGLTHIVRAHEVPTNGFFFHFDKKCITIFSSSHYCGNNNECAILLIEGDTMRIIRIDTSNNQSATD